VDGPVEDKRNEERSLALKIVIVGNGKVGFSLAEQLVREKYDVVIVDMREDTLRRAADALDIMSVKGNGISAATLIEAGVPEADLMVAATNSDEINMVCCLTAKHLGAKYTIARIRNPEYNAGLSDLKRNMGIDMVINPENATAVEISRLLRFPSAANIETFCRGRVELIGFRLLEEDFLVNRPLHALSDQVKKLSLLFCAVERLGGEVVIPNGSFVPKAGDKLYLIGRPSSLDQFFRLLGRYSPKVKSVFIVGGGKISLYLSDVLEKMKMRVKIVEIQEERCRFISERLPHTTVICGDGTDQELLESERLAATDAFVALTDRDEDNLILSLYAMQKGVQKVVTKSNRQNYAGIAQTIGLDSVISPKLITAAQILQVVRGMQNSQGSVMNTLYRIADGSAEAMEFTASAKTRHLGVPLKELHLRKGILIAVLARGGDIIIPEGSSSIQEGDSVILISRDLRILDLNDIYEDEGSFTVSGGNNEH
jgi:trk system potassium uptake protein TrkA